MTKSNLIKFLTRKGWQWKRNHHYTCVYMYSITNAVCPWKHTTTAWPYLWLDKCQKWAWLEKLHFKTNASISSSFWPEIFLKLKSKALHWDLVGALAVFYSDDNDGKYWHACIHSCIHTYTSTYTHSWYLCCVQPHMIITKQRIWLPLTMFYKCILTPINNWQNMSILHNEKGIGSRPDPFLRTLIISNR